MELDENTWPEDEAAQAVEELISDACVYEIPYALERAQFQVPFWEETFESDALMLRFVTAFNNSSLLTTFLNKNKVEFKLNWVPVQCSLTFGEYHGNT